MTGAVADVYGRKLAATRAKTMSPRALLEQLGQRLELLSAGPADFSPRQRSIRGALDWSYELLDDEARAVFACMAVFAGSATLDAVTGVCSDAIRSAHAVKLAVSKEGIEISASSPEYGEAKEILEKEYKGDPLAIGFNAQYMLDFLAAAAEGPVSIELKDEQSAGQMRPLADENYRYRYIIMPMRI